MTKLNVGCGERFSPAWVNIDFHPCHESIKRVNLLRGLPFPDNSFDAVYSSHVLEHFPRDTTAGLVREMYRVLKPGGIIRVVVPDLEESCREYLRVLDRVANSPLARKQYEWVILEMMDQLTRTCPSGLMGPYFDRLALSNDQEMRNYVQARTQNTTIPILEGKSIGDRLRGLTPGKVRTKLIYVYINLIKHLLPKGLRDAIVDDSRVGEKHRWMYDRYGMTLLLQNSGFADIRFLSAKESQISGFSADNLDTLSDGRPYKNVSLYSEAVKPK